MSDDAMGRTAVKLRPGACVHFVGIGGTGLSAIARVMLEQGYRISGSDQASNAFTAALQADGAAVYHGHRADHVDGAEAVIATSAAPADHIELQAARERGIPVYRRADMIAAVMQGRHCVAVAGTHGKTTTTSMIVHLLTQVGRAPDYIVGGVMANTGRNAGVGDSGVFVIEADEYDNMFHGLHPHTAVVTSVEYDHPDFFETPQALRDSFAGFLAQIEPGGTLIACTDDPAVRELARSVDGVRLLTYGTAAAADWRVADVHVEQGDTVFTVARSGAAAGRVRLRVPGMHNALNATAALLVAHTQGVPFAEAAEALTSFAGSGRRFEVRAEVDGVLVVDDYAHHPTAIRTTIAAARSLYPDHALWAVWQPHTYSRVSHLFDDFAAAFTAADHVVVTDIYAAREAHNPTGVSAARLASAIDNPDVHHAPRLIDAVHLLAEWVRPPAVVLIMSAGDAPQIGVQYVERLRERGGS